MPDDTQLLTWSQLTVGYGKAPVLRGATGSVGRGEVVGLTGANGVGKSTLILAIAGLVRADDGAVLYEGQRIESISAHKRFRMGLSIVLQGGRNFGSLSVRENLAFAARRAGQRNCGSISDVARDLFPELRSLLRRPANELSGGEKVMLSIARAIACNPGLLLLDEPTLGLSRTASARVSRAIHALAAEGIGVLVAVHPTAVGFIGATRTYLVTQEGATESTRSQSGE